MLCIAAVLTLLFGKISYKEIKEYVRKHTEGHGKECSGGECAGDSRDRGEVGDCSGGKEGEDGRAGEEG